MNNGSTDVFCDVIALAGSSVARTVWQQNLVLHFCDLVRYARGMGGFPDELIPCILAIAGNPEPRAVGIWITPPHLEPVSAIIDKPLDPHASYWLGKAVA